MGTYSILYTVESDEDHHAVDWDWIKPDRWAQSVMPYGLGHSWSPQDGVLDYRAYRIVLTHFGLDDWETEFPIGRVIIMGPRELADARRKKEAEFHLPRKEMFSDTIGYRVAAEMHGIEAVSV